MREKPPYRVRILHEVLGEGRVDDEVTVVRHNRAGLSLRHAKSGLRRANEVEVLQDLRVCEGDDLYRNTLLPLFAV